jgi:2'-5' RNA ligase
MRQQLADLANQRIRSTGGYGGVSVEPSDIPASLIAGLIPQYGPIPANIPITSIMDAVESMFAGKFASADTTKTSFGSLILAVVGDTMAGWERAVASEMEACARHLDKGRDAGSWEPRRIERRDVDTLADLLQTGAVTRTEAVKQALDNRRRWVDVGGQIMGPPTAATPDEAADEEPPYQGAGGPVATTSQENPAGGGGYVLLPHDADGIYHDKFDLTKAASDPGDPNPVEAEHVYNQMLANYPPKSIQWIKKARWIGPMAVDPERVDTQDEDSWSASHEPARVKHFAKKYKSGDDVKPGVCVQEPGQSTVKVIDGHHRFLGARKAGEPYMAYVGFVDKDGGDWDETHSYQFHKGDDPQNKSAVPGLTKRSGMVSIDLPDGLIKPVPGGPTDHHITLAYLGSDVDDGTLNDVLRTAKHVAAETRPFTITASGIDSFPPSAGSDGKVPAYAPVSVTDELKALREPFARYHASEHQDFTPHITLAYLDEGDPLPDAVPQVRIPVDAVHVHLGGRVFARIPLGSSAVGKSAETPVLSTVHKPLGTHGLWGDKTAQLPAYIQNIAHALLRDGHDESEAIQLAVGAVRRWAAGGGKVTPEVRAAAAAALAEWEKLKAEHSKTKALDPTGETALKVGPKGYIHGWIFVGVPGIGDVVRHPEHGHGVITEHSDKHVTVAFNNGKTHSFEAHRHEGKSGHFTKRGDVEHEGPRKPKEPERTPADRVWDDPSEINNLTDDELEDARAGLLKHHEKIGVWGPEADRMDDVREQVQREIYDRQYALGDAKYVSDNPDSAAYAERKKLELIMRDTERRARERGIDDPDLITGHRAARVELNRRVFKNPAKWNAHDHLAIFGGSPEDQKRVEDSMTRIFSDIPPEKGSTLKHVHLTDKNMPDEHTQGLYYSHDHRMEINPVVLTEENNKVTQHSMDVGWYSASEHKTALDRTLDHETGHHLDYDLSPDERNKLFTSLTKVIGKTEYKAMPAANQHVFVNDNKSEIVNGIGTYASTNDRELLAELWAEYHGRKAAGAPDFFQNKSAQIVGRYMAGHDTEFNPEAQD